jgi:hypothetical protein
MTATTTTEFRIEDRLVEYAELLRDIQRWLLRGLDDQAFGRRTAQAREYADNIDRALAGAELLHLLARSELLEEVAVTTHKLTSVDELPTVLRNLADTLELVRTTLDASGYDEWDQVAGLEDRP